jgi:hypothetical protein
MCSYKYRYSGINEFFSTISPSPLNPPGACRFLMAIAFSPLQSNEKKIVDELFKTGSVSHALQVMNLVPYSQRASCTTLGKTPKRYGKQLYVVQLD